MVTVIDYGAGNLRSVCLALEKIQSPWQVSDDPEIIAQAERVIFPGVGAAGSAVKVLREKGLEDSIKQYLASGKPFLGICLGTQIIFDHSDEDGSSDCLSLVSGNVVKFKFPADKKVTVPHMGWNQVNTLVDHPIFENIESGANFYFVHSYYPVPSNEITIAKTEYEGLEFTCAIAKDNLVATQFHPEKSGRHGLDLLKNFVKWDGKYAK